MSVYACADLHGRYDLWTKIKNILKPDDTLYFLGDAIDRGEDGYKIMKEMLADPRVTYILGNHEYMMYKVCTTGMEYSPDMDIWLYNNGYPTFQAWDRDGRPIEVIASLVALPTEVYYINKEDVTIILNHAGRNPDVIHKDIHDVVWDREHITTTSSAASDKHYPYLIVHGHTPNEVLEKMIDRAGQPQFIEEDTRIIWYWNNFKVCLDTGAVWTGQTVLFNLDTYQSIVIKEDEKNDND